MDAEKPRIIQLPKIHDTRGNLTFAQTPDQVPFDIRRAYWLYDVPADSRRGGHAHRRLRQLLIAVSGSFRVNLFDGRKRLSFTLNRPYQALYIPNMYWRTIDDFASGSVCLVLASEPYDEADYIRDQKEFKLLTANK